ncbi:MAG TPA: glycosyltransferase [Chloroflexota bacterium]|nr:glycosyltransferase [Chloroflexota bacterium]
MTYHDFTMALFTFAAMPLALRGEWLYRRMPVLSPCPEAAEGQRPYPSLSIIIPARNEAANLHRLLPTLQAQQYPGELEILVVDDNSEDNTAVVADYYGVCVQRLTRLPTGWLGKPNAVHQGVLASRGEWLLFTDADMQHHPASAVTAVSYALANGLDGLSIFPRQATMGSVDRAALMVGFAGLFAGQRPHSATLNGQYILLRRDVYEQSGGMTAVRHEMLEDLALGVHLQQQGYHVPMLRGEELATVYMYDNLPHLWRGFSRLGSGSLKYSGAGAFGTAFFVTGAMMPLLAPLFILFGLVNRRWLFVTWLLTVPGFITWGRRFGGSANALLAPLGATLVQAASCWGLLTRLMGRGIQWKNRLVR